VIQVNHEELKLNAIPHFLVHADDVNLLGGSVHSVKKNAADIVVASKETGIEVNDDSTNCMVTSPYRNAEMPQYVYIGNSFFESVEEYEYLRTTLTIQNSIHKEIKIRLKSGYA
jgi:hypothetical protein